MSHVRWTVVALLFFAVTINDIEPMAGGTMGVAGRVRRDISEPMTL